MAKCKLPQPPILTKHEQSGTFPGIEGLIRPNIAKGYPTNPLRAANYPIVVVVHTILPRARLFIQGLLFERENLRGEARSRR